MEPNDDTNLTEKLFTRVKKVLETSEVSNSSPVDEQDSALSDSFIDGALSPRWYRLLRRPTWASWRTPSAATEAARTASLPADTVARVDRTWA